jgi:peptide/nickel transport system permease protein
MLKFLAKRLVRAVLTVLGVMSVTFLLSRLSGNPAGIMLGPQATKADIATLSRTLGFDKPLDVQYLHYLGGAVHGDLGASLQQHVSATSLVLHRLPVTLELALTAFVIGIGLAFLLAVSVELSGSRALRAVVLWIASIRQAVPVFLFGLLAILVFAVYLHMFPSIGSGGVRHLVLPAATLGTFELALYLRLFDSSFGEQRDQDYVRTAYATGLEQRSVFFRHILPNSLLPVLTVAGLNLGALIGGTVVVELVFGWNGVGQLVINAVNQRDYPIVEAGLFVFSIIFVLANFLTDVLLATLDPRVRLR